MNEASRIVFHAPSNITPKALVNVSNAVVGSLKGKTLRKGSRVSVSGVSLELAVVEPEGYVKIGDGTEIEIMPKPMKSDILLAVDTSYSMSKDDYQPNRLGAAKNAVMFFLNQKTDTKDRVGLVTFGSTCFEKLPLTNVNDELLAKASSELQDTKPAGRTSISSALNTAVEIFKNQGTPENPKILIMLTDGADNMGENPAVEALKLKENSVAVYPVLIGTKTHYDEKILTEIAGITGGRFYSAPTKDELINLYSELAGKKKKIREPKKIEIPEAKPRMEGKIARTLKEIKKKVW
ncbi:MAG: VWA domain-containing protein [Thermoplasmatales archaeon]|nr:VWA domain-containing protein [Thermoplasmatales archaeon]